MNKLYRDLIRERIRFALAAATVATKLEHNGLKGALRESLMAELFRPLLPPDFGVTTGVIISADDFQSAQQDIIVYTKRILPPFLTEGPAIVPIESVVATIEVKSTLTATELVDSIQNVRSVRRLRMMIGNYGPDGTPREARITDEQGNKVPTSQERPASGAISFLFAFQSDLKEKSEIERFCERSDDAYVFTGMCVVGKGLFGPEPNPNAYYDHNLNEFRSSEPSHPLTNTLIVVQAADEAHSEILEFLAGVHRLVTKVANTRGYPPLHGYLR